MFSPFGMKVVTPVVSQSDIWPYSINLLQMVAKYVCVAVSCLSQTFVVWSLPGAFQFNVVLSTSSTSVSDIVLHSTLGFCWQWFLIQQASSLCWTFFPKHFFPKVLYFFCSWCIFHIGIFLSKKVVKFLAVCSTHSCHKFCAKYIVT